MLVDGSSDKVVEEGLRVYCLTVYEMCLWYLCADDV